MWILLFSGHSNPLSVLFEVSAEAEEAAIVQELAGEKDKPPPPPDPKTFYRLLSLHQVAEVERARKTGT